MITGILYCEALRSSPHPLTPLPPPTSPPSHLRCTMQVTESVVNLDSQSISPSRTCLREPRGFSPAMYEPEVRDRGEKQFVHHWAVADVSTVVANAQEYEAVYSKMVAGDHYGALRMLLAQPERLMQDRSWALLKRELENHTTHGMAHGQRWEGVLNFTEK